jgi:uncharacterized protein YjeT (DUF2065 family)
MWQEIFTAIALMLVIEGIIPFWNPQMFRKTLSNLLKMSDSSFRVIGVASMMGGLCLLYLVR